MRFRSSCQFSNVERALDSFFSVTVNAIQQQKTWRNGKTQKKFKHKYPQRFLLSHEHLYLIHVGSTQQVFHHVGLLIRRHWYNLPDARVQSISKIWVSYEIHWSLSFHLCHCECMCAPIQYYHYSYIYSHELFPKDSFRENHRQCGNVTMKSMRFELRLFGHATMCEGLGEIVH